MILNTQLTKVGKIVAVATQTTGYANMTPKASPWSTPTNFLTSKHLWTTAIPRISRWAGGLVLGLGLGFSGLGFRARVTVRANVRVGVRVRARVRVRLRVRVKVKVKVRVRV